MKLDHTCIIKTSFPVMMNGSLLFFFSRSILRHKVKRSDFSPIVYDCNGRSE